MSPLTTTLRDTGTGPVLLVAGELDYSTAAELRRVVTGIDLGPGRLLVLDLGGLDFCDSSGITALIVARNHATAARADIALVSVPGPVLRILRVTGLDQVFRLEPGAGTRNRAVGD
ncbi:STAS domain-containing protein [Streptomyces clavifer]|uniref:STAS domain-containing protein n=1 Tax=Streptomyces clavifer TaxID=68188 RepID=UPI0033AC7AB6